MITRKKPLLMVQHLSLAFGGVIAIDNLSFVARQGEITVLLQFIPDLFDFDGRFPLSVFPQERHHFPERGGARVVETSCGVGTVFASGTTFSCVCIPGCSRQRKEYVPVGALMETRGNPAVMRRSSLSVAV